MCLCTQPEGNRLHDTKPLNFRGGERTNCRGMSSVRVLVVEDNELFRRVVCSMLETRPELQVIGETSNGLEAVQKAEELQPDVIVLDIALPSVNGIEVARRIRKTSPECKILLVSQESSPEVVQEALSVGACAYVLKVRAGSDLLAAVEGKQIDLFGYAISAMPISPGERIKPNSSATHITSRRKRPKRVVPY
jgi:DNA-binding NarL/FixJ family response regulator